MTADPHAAAMTLFRLIGAGTRFRVHSKGVEIMLPDEAQSFASEVEAHAEEIAEMLRFQTRSGRASG